MLIKRPADIASSEITPEREYVNRRSFMKEAARKAAAAAAVPGVLAAAGRAEAGETIAGRTKDPRSLVGRDARRAGPGGREALQEELTPYEDVTQYNNFYEFGADKEDPYQNAGQFEPRPWTVQVSGECNNPGTYDLEEFAGPYDLEDRVYRLRCVEAWSMVIPWRGFPLSRVINRAEPTGNANFIAFTTVMRPSQMPGQRTRLLDWPYREGLRMDEAMHPLTLLATGLYGENLPNQNGAPLRLVVPWKYGFKSIKSIVRIELVEEMPYTTWSAKRSDEYGFYANVNPNVDHPRWSQARERRIGELRRRPTQMFNGYADQVAPMYEGMDLRKWF